ncbi:arginine decarboxylase SpeA [Gottschalkia acidurici 9a]|uniref:Arginine decarboxylase SpeA n=1 Tax=Gottschalkia acidurici (strain ATCC 7906 / DSM 604 / BCRC 14475 / CIP 104303 / KCTC 5404 / NCIMB 10678 / 9a) TaxID=1128398 RepID=K0AWS9_GOTA9|nr:aminotransferase class I/II-fold pyridoxal phosphate-dependent enzyme [Gottschalkia acidurici]AFS77190.1 arginine decarboxylase SpeA [Gottschalkia acidurici 9a]
MLIPYIDVTEVEGTDNLHLPTAMIKSSQELAAKTFKAKKTFYSVNGTTGGIYAAITSQVKPGEKILIQRDCHRSVHNALVLGRIDHDYMYPVYDSKCNILTGINPDDIEKKLKEDSEIKAIVITYPSYYGVCSDIEKICKIAHRYNKLLIVDEAHGSHLGFSERLPKSSIEAGADIVIQSTHKTLPAFTQSSMVHVGTDRVDIEKLEKMMSIYQTTSPSYLLLSSIDYAVGYMDVYGREKLNVILDKIQEVTIYLERLQKVKIFNKNDIVHNNFHDFDNTKLLFNVEGITGKKLEEILRRDYHIQLEMSDYYYGLALTSILDENSDLEKLALAIEDISKKDEYTNKDLAIKEFNDIRNINPKIVMSLYEAFYNNKISVQLKESIGKISGDFIIPYPPGIPILAPGEIVTKEIVEYIEKLIENNVQILGLTNGNILITK